jgi:KDO2-lipid IV(A) lauroyltransferase
MIAQLISFLYLLAWKIVRTVPEASAYRFFRYIANRAVRRQRKSFTRLKANLRRVKPELSEQQLNELTERSMQSYLRYWCDAFRLPTWSKERIVSTVTVEGEEMFRSLVAKGKGVIVSLPHSGNWDHAGAYFSATGIPIISVAEKLKPERVFQAFLRYRERIGIRIYSTDENVIPLLNKHLSNGEVVALVADRDLSKSGIEVNFFGGVAKMPSGPALLALRNNSYLVVAHVTYTQNGIHIKFSEPLSPDPATPQSKVENLIQQSADIFAEGIARNPEDWHMLQRIWIDQNEAMKR